MITGDTKGGIIDISVYKTTTGIDNLVNNNYLKTFKFLKYILIDTSASKSIIKHSCIPNNVYYANKKVSNTYWQTNSSNLLISHKVPLIFVFLEFCLIKEIMHNFAINETSTLNYKIIIRYNLL